MRVHPRVWLVVAVVVLAGGVAAVAGAALGAFDRTPPETGDMYRDPALNVRPPGVREISRREDPRGATMGNWFGVSRPSVHVRYEGDAEAMDAAWTAFRDEAVASGWELGTERPDHWSATKAFGDGRAHLSATRVSATRTNLLARLSPG